VKSFILIISIFAHFALWSQNFKIMSYNVENLFDTVDDPLTNDEDFTPTGAYKWTKARLTTKCNNIYKAIVAAGEGSMIQIIGLCEVENKYVLNQLTNYTPLSKFGYKYVHYDSPDRRGIDVALLYKEDEFKLITSYPIAVGKSYRDILYVKGVAMGDTLHLFVNHWTSKYGGGASEGARIIAAKKLKQSTDSIFQTNPNANICAMGDFNDYPDSNPIKTLGAKTPENNLGNSFLYNMSQQHQDNKQGTIKYQNKWEMIDLFFVSGNLRFNKQGLHCEPTDSKIFKADFLLEKVKGGGEAPKRTYVGSRYVGGFSDHLPIVLTLKTE